MSSRSMFHFPRQNGSVLKDAGLNVQDGPGNSIGMSHFRCPNCSSSSSSGGSQAAAAAESKDELSAYAYNVEVKIDREDYLLIQ